MVRPVCLSVSRLAVSWPVSLSASPSVSSLRLLKGRRHVDKERHREREALQSPFLAPLALAVAGLALTGLLLPSAGLAWVDRTAAVRGLTLDLVLALQSTGEQGQHGE